jgi:hypothetical protein
MKRILLPSIALLVIVTSCQQAPVEYVHRVDTLYIRDTLHVPDTNALKLKGNLHGYARLYDFGGSALDRSGITVHFKNTGYSTVTDALGKWTMRDLPTSTYNIVFSKEGYDTVRLYSLQFVGGGDVYGVNAPTLPLIPTVSILDLNLSKTEFIRDDYLAYYLGGRLSAATKGISARLFVGRDSTVSLHPGTYIYAFNWPIDSVTGEFVQTSYLNSIYISTYGIKRGDRVFIAAYPVAGPSRFTYWNPQLGDVEVGLGPRSTILSFKN